MTYATSATGLAHGFRAGSATSLCGLLERPAPELDPTPRGRLCRLCAARLRRGSRPGPEPAPHRPDAEACACRTCRAARREGVREHVRAIGRTLTEIIPREVRRWPGARDHVGPAEAALGAWLMMWELSGSSRAVLRVEILELERALFQAWNEAREAFDRFGGPRAR